MKATKEELQIQSLPYDINSGEKLEPEEVPTQRVVTGSAPITGRESGSTLGSIPANLIRESNALEFANEARTRCITCKHFDQKSYQDWRRTAGGHAFSESIKGQCMQDFGITDPADKELTHAMNFLGVCRVFTEIRNDLSITRPDYPCPANPPLWEPVTSTDERIASMNYDRILQIAKGS